MSGIVRSVEYISNLANRANNTKEEIINAYNSTENIKNKIKEMELKAQEEMKIVPKNIHINISEVEPIVLRKNFAKQGQER